MKTETEKLNLVTNFTRDAREPLFELDDSYTATSKDLTLNETDYVYNLYEKVSLKLAERYDDKSWAIRMETSIFNSCLCTPRASFWLTKSSILKLHQNDLNHKRPKRKSLNSDEFVRLLHQLASKMRIAVFTRPCGRIQYMATITNPALQYNIAKKAGRPIEDLIAEQETEIMDFFQGNEGEFSTYKIQPRKTRADQAKLVKIRESRAELAPEPEESTVDIQERLRIDFRPTKRLDALAILECFEWHGEFLSPKEFESTLVDVLERKGFSISAQQYEIRSFIRETLREHLQVRE